MKLVRESLGKIPGSEELSESGGFRVNGVTYDIWRTNIGKIYAGEKGILSHNDTLIPWEEIKELLKKYSEE